MKGIRLGIILLLLLVVGGVVWWGCGPGGPGERHIGLSVIGQSLYGAGPDQAVEFRQGDKVTIRVTTDEPMLFHLHGWEIETWVLPGNESTLQFTADRPGRHALMIHQLGEAGSGRRVEILLGFVDVLPPK